MSYAVCALFVDRNPHFCATDGFSYIIPFVLPGAVSTGLTSPAFDRFKIPSQNRAAGQFRVTRVVTFGKMCAQLRDLLLVEPSQRRMTIPGPW